MNVFNSHILIHVIAWKPRPKTNPTKKLAQKEDREGEIALRASDKQHIGNSQRWDLALQYLILDDSNCLA